MKKKIYTRPISVVLSFEMFQRIKEITDHEGIGISDYIREAVQEKLATDNQKQTE
jgi:predicted DNA-binding protein